MALFRTFRENVWHIYSGARPLFDLKTIVDVSALIISAIVGQETFLIKLADTSSAALVTILVTIFWKRLTQFLTSYYLEISVANNEWIVDIADLNVYKYNRWADVRSDQITHLLGHHLRLLDRFEDFWSWQIKQILQRLVFALKWTIDQICLID